MACRCAPALIALRSTLNRTFPGRNIASDGCCGDALHASRRSDHNPDASGYAHAFDVTHDPGMGVDCHRLANLFLEDARTKYVIWDGRIGYPATGWKTYTGTNPHRHHCHVSIKASATFDDRPWRMYPDTPPPPPPTRRPPTMVLAYKEGTGAVYLFFGRGDFVPVEEPADRDALTAKGVPGPIPLRADTWTKWGGP